MLKKNSTIFCQKKITIDLILANIHSAHHLSSQHILETNFIAKNGAILNIQTKSYSYLMK